MDVCLSPFACPTSPEPDLVLPTVFSAYEDGGDYSISLHFPQGMTVDYSLSVGELRCIGLTGGDAPTSVSWYEVDIGSGVYNELVLNYNVKGTGLLSGTLQYLGTDNDLRTAYGQNYPPFDLPIVFPTEPPG